MAGKGRFYRVAPVGLGIRKSYPLKEVKAGTVVQSLETAPQGSLDVVDVLLPTGRTRSVYSFQLRHVIKKPKTWGKR